MTVEYRLHGAVLWRFLELIIEEAKRETIKGLNVHYEPNGCGRISVTFETDQLPPHFPDPMGPSEDETPNIRGKVIGDEADR